MFFVVTKLLGAQIIEPVPIEEERGFFARAYCAREFAEVELNRYVAEDCEVVLYYDLWLRMQAEAPAIYLDGPALAADRDHPARKTHALYTRRMHEHVAVLDRFYARHGHRADLIRVRRRAFAAAYYRLASAEAVYGRAFPDGLRWLAKSVRFHPAPAWRQRRHTLGILLRGLHLIDPAPVAAGR